MSALDDVIIYHAENCQSGSECDLSALSRAELAQLRADLQAAQEQIAWLTSDIGESGLAAINRLIAACNRMDIPQQYTPDLSIARDEILRQARKLAEARNVMIGVVGFFDYRPARSWLAAHPAPAAEQQPPNGEGRP